MNCKDCKYAIIAKSSKVFVKKNVTTTISVERVVNCECRPIRTFTYTGNDILCNEFLKKGVDKKN
jgi:hypothetical protein